MTYCITNIATIKKNILKNGQSECTERPGKDQWLYNNFKLTGNEENTNSNNDIIFQPSHWQILKHVMLVIIVDHIYEVISVS